MLIFKKCLVFIFLWPVLCQLSSNYEAFNLSCINPKYIASQAIPIQLTIPPFSLVNIQADLRHLDSTFDLMGVNLTLKIRNVDTSMEYSESLNLNVTTNAYSLYAATNIILSAQFGITDVSGEKLLARSYLLARSVSAVVVPSEPPDQDQKTFLFAITNQDYISLPYNAISWANSQSFNGYFLTKEKVLREMSSRQTSATSYSDYWSSFDTLFMPYLPYFSNCQNNGDYLYFSQMIHNVSECQLFGYGSTPINEFNFGSSAVADTCTITRSCMYDQIPGNHEYPVWSTIGSGQYLFYVTAQQFSYPYNPLNAGDKPKLVPCQIMVSEGDNTTSTFPLKTLITLGYYQKTQTNRYILNCEVQFSLYTEAHANFEYQLQIKFAPLNHTQILLDFGFRWYIYMLVFIIIGVISNLQFLIFWLYHICTTVKSKIHARLCIYLRMIKEIVKGVLCAVFIIIFLTFFVEIIMNGTFFGIPLSSSFDSVWDYLIYDNIGVMADTTLASLRTGRMGLCYIVISVYLAYHLSPLLVGKDRRSKQYEQYQILGQKFKPFEWNRGKFLFGMYLIALCSAGYLYFTYSSMFNANIWLIIAMMQVAQMVLQQLLNSLYQDVLPTIPMKLSVGVLAYLATMGAIDLYYFMLGYLVDVGISTIERVYLSLIQQKITRFVEQKNEELHRFYINLLNDEEEEHERKSQEKNSQSNDNEKILIENYMNDVELLQEEIEEQYTEADLKQVKGFQSDQTLKDLFLKAMLQRNQQLHKKENKAKNETAFMKFEDKVEQRREIQNKKFQLLTDSAASMVQYLLQPAIVLILWITYNSSSVLSNFQVAEQNCILYLLSSIILAISYQFNIIIIIHVLQLYFNFDYKHLIEELLMRFREKNSFWITDCEEWEKKLEDIETKSKGCNRYCLSSQMFFVVSLYTFLIYLFMIGFTTIISARVNIFRDPFVVLIIIFWVLMLKFFQWLLKKLVYCFDIWDYASFASGGNRITEQPEALPSDQQTQHVLQSSSRTPSLRFTFKQLGQQFISKSDESRLDRRSVLQAKLRTICKKLQPVFEGEQFRLQFAVRNKDFIRNNIEKILPLVESFPENDNHWLGKNESGSDLILKKKKEAKNIDPAVSDFVSGWLKRVQANRVRRKEDGIEKERKLKKCNFCFRTWAIYYGYEGICLECSRRLFAGEKLLKKE